MACHYLQMDDSREFYSKLKSRDSDIVLKMAKCVLSACERKKERIDIFDVTFSKSLGGIVFTIDQSQYRDLLQNCMDDLIKMEEYELCARIKKVLEEQ